MQATWKRLIAGILLVVGWLFLSGPGDIPLTPHCEPMGPLNRARAVIQGERFWHSTGVVIERQISQSDTIFALAACRPEVYRRAGMEMTGRFP